MRKLVLLLIITMSLMLTSGFSSAFDAQDKLNAALQNLGAEDIKVQIITTTQTAKVDTDYPEQNYKSFSPNVTFTDQLGSHTLRKIVSPEQTIYIEVLQLAKTQPVIETYLRLREQALAGNGEANLALTCKVPLPAAGVRALGVKLIDDLGGQQVLQAAGEDNLYFSAGAFIPGWGKETPGLADKLNVQVLLRPDSAADYTDVYILAPVMQGDLGDL